MTPARKRNRVVEHASTANAPRVLKSAKTIIAAIGGNGPVAVLTGRKTQHVTNWKHDGRLPASTFLVVSAKLAELGYRASPKLWGITEP